MTIKLRNMIRNMIPGWRTTFTMLVLMFALAFLTSTGSASIACFKCVSINGNNPACEDPFHNNYSASIYENPCLAGRKHREGVFPATACLKLSGYFGPNSERLMIRACALDSGGLTTDTEIIRVSHCGSFVFENKYVKGCLQSCDDADGCNTAGPSLSSSSANTFYLLLLQYSVKRFFSE